jgi:DNA processing protein
MNNNNNLNLLKILRLYRTENIGPVNYRLIINKYGINNSFDFIENIGKINGKKINIPNILDIEKEIEDHAGFGGEILTYENDFFPKDLYNMYNSFPPILSTIGDKNLLKKNLLAIIGTRLPSLQGVQYTKYLCETLGKEGYINISGFAKGIDTVVHESSLKYGTIAFIPSGINIIFPEINKFLFNSIKEKGLIITDRAFNQQATSSNFHLRNKLMGFFAKGIIVTEATLQSGTLSTASFAKKINKPIFSVPGHPLDYRYGGNNYLIQHGAFLVDSAESIIKIVKNKCKEEQLSIDNIEINNEVSQLMKERVKSLLSYVPISIEDICIYTGYSLGEVNYILLELEILGYIERLFNGYICMV